MPFHDRFRARLCRAQSGDGKLFAILDSPAIGTRAIKDKMGKLCSKIRSAADWLCRAGFWRRLSSACAGPDISAFIDSVGLDDEANRTSNRQHSSNSRPRVVPVERGARRLRPRSRERFRIRAAGRAGNVSARGDRDAGLIAAAQVEVEGLGHDASFRRRWNGVRGLLPFPGRFREARCRPNGDGAWFAGRAPRRPGDVRPTRLCCHCRERGCKCAGVSSPLPKPPRSPPSPCWRRFPRRSPSPCLSAQPNGVVRTPPPRAR